MTDNRDNKQWEKNGEDSTTEVLEGGTRDSMVVDTQRKKGTDDDEEQPPMRRPQTHIKVPEKRDVSLIRDYTVESDQRSEGCQKQGTNKYSDQRMRVDTQISKNLN